MDIRARHVNDVFAIHHGLVFQHAFFGTDVMEPVIGFLAQHPTETVLMRVKEEYTEENNTRTFTLRPDWEMMEYSCEENNKSLWEGRIKVPK